MIFHKQKPVFKGSEFFENRFFVYYKAICCAWGNNTIFKSKYRQKLILILNTNKIQGKICAEIQYKPVFNSCEIVGLILPNLKITH